MKIGVQINHKHITDKLSGYAKTQMRFLVSNTLNGVAFDLKNHIQKAMPVSFDRPTKFTLNSLAVEKSKKDTLKAEVFFKDSQAEQGKAQREFIRPGAMGSPSRSQKRSEYLLTRSGVLPAGWITTPGRFFNDKLDVHGNVPGSYYKQIINLLQLKKVETAQAKKQSMASQKRAAKMGVADEFFAVPPGKNRLGKNGGWLPPGVWKRTGKLGDRPVQYFKFVKRAKYQMRLDLDKEARSMLQASAQKNWNSTVEWIKKDLAK
jgi:hypothetical protein